MKLFAILVLGLVSTSLCDLVTMEAFNGPPFSVKPPSGMYELGGLNFDNVTNGNQIVAYGDFNNDKFTDIVSLTDDLLTLTVFIYNHESFSFWPFTQIKATSPITAVIPADYNKDGFLDLLLLSSQTNAETGPSTTLSFFYRTQADPFFGSSANTPNYQTSLNTNTQPFLFDVDGDRSMDLMYMNGATRTVLTFNNGALVPSNFAEYASPAGSGCKDPAEAISNIFTSPHSNSFVDFNGDCAADLFITSLDASNNTVFETWLRNPADGKFCLVDASTLGYSQISQVTFGDIDNNGRIDLVFADSPASYTMNLHIIYNQFPANYKTPCAISPNVMSSPFVSSAYTATESIGGITQITPIATPGFQSVRLYTEASSSASIQSQRIRVGDINIDGYPDLLLVVTPTTTSTTAASGYILLGINEGGVIKFDNSTLQTPDDHSYFSVLLENKIINPASTPLSSFNALSASFFDFDELGNPGLWVVTRSQGKSSLVAIFNFVNSENFILKTLGLNGFKPQEDIVESLGGVYYGPSIECVLTDIDGNARLAKSIQLPQSAYTPLDLPYMLLGLGRTNNYVENFVMGISKSISTTDLQTTEWTPIIPNSQLIVNPLIEEAWTLDVFVNPTSETMFVVLITLIILLILGVIIIYLHRKEKEEDEKNRDRILIG